jgi:anaerobic selenocysteine-containing dehydrogenase
MINSYVRYGPPVVPPPVGGIDDWEIMLEIAARVERVDRAVMLRQFMTQLVQRVTSGTGVGNDRTPQEILDVLTGNTPPEKVFDLLVRAGDFGDHFGARPDGVTLELLRERPTGIDFGPVDGGRLAALLRTPDRRIHLTPAEIVSDLPRLESFRANGGYRRPDSQEFILSSRRERRSMNSWLHNVHAFAKGPDRCTLLMHPEDALRMELSDGDTVRAYNPTGSIVVRLTISTEVMPGHVNLPHGYGHYLPGSRLHLAQEKPGDNVNLVLDEAIDQPSGNVAFNRILVRIEPIDTPQ